nr:hypothetical protein [Gordonia otitidis]
MIAPEGSAVILLPVSQTAGIAAKFATAPSTRVIVCSKTAFSKESPSEPSSLSAVSVQLNATMSEERTRVFVVPLSFPGSLSFASKFGVPVMIDLPPTPSGSSASCASSFHTG